MRKLVEITMVLSTNEKIADIRKEAMGFKNPEEEIIYCVVRNLKCHEREAKSFIKLKKNPTTWFKELKKH